MLAARETATALGREGAGAGASWSSLFMGAIIALGVIFLLTLMGVALGLTIVDPARDADPLAGIPVGAGIYLVIVHLIAMAIGGYTAARLAGSAWLTRAILHGAAVWALVSFLILMLATTGVGFLVSGAAAAVTTVTGGAGQAMEGLIPEDMGLPDLASAEMVTPDDFISTLPQETQNSLRDQNVGVDQIRDAGDDAIGQVFGQQEQREMQQAFMRTAMAIMRDPAAADQAINRLTNELTGPNGVLSEDDRQQAAQVVQIRLNLSQNDAGAIVEGWQQQMEQSVQGARTSLEGVQRQATSVAQDIADAVSAAAWFIFIASLLGLLAAIGGAWLGRPPLVAPDRV
ncbi:MAG: hypothetical protein WED00_13160 [Aquisalimonadaceae bacterium]